MQTILGSGGVIGSVLLKELGKKGETIRLVSRTVKPAGGAKEAVAADLSDLQQTIDAVSGSTVVYLVAGLKYDLKVWQELWPKIMDNTIEACKRASAKLVFFDNVYMYGRANGAMTEGTPFNPCSKKGEIRARIATKLLDEVRAGNLTALIARAADFYGPNATTGVANVLVFDKFAKGQKPALLINDSTKHSYTFTPDAARGLVMLGESETSWNQSWHLPTSAPPPTGKEFCEMAASAFGARPTYSILSKWMLMLAGIFNSTIREVPEMLYQNESDYIFDSTKFFRAFKFERMSYAEGVKLTAAAYK